MKVRSNIRAGPARFDPGKHHVTREPRTKKIDAEAHLATARGNEHLKKLAT